MAHRLHRRDYLKSIGAASLATGVARADSQEVGSQQATGLAARPFRADEDWPMFQVDAANTGTHPDATGPTSDVTARWRSKNSHQLWTSPAVADGTVYIGRFQQEGVEGSLYALDEATGELRDGNWPVDTKSPTTPAVVDGTVYIGSEPGPGGLVYALDATSGDQQWSTETSDGIFTPPTVTGGTVYVGSWDGRVYALDAATGEVKDGNWPFTIEENITDSSPAVANGTVYIGSTHGGTEPFKGYVYALDADTGELRGGNWPFETEAVHSSPAVANGIVYVGSLDGNVYALNASDGTVQWSYEIDQVYGSPAVADGTVYIGSWNNKVYALDATTGEPVWNQPFQTEGSVNSPAVVNGAIYVGGGNKVYALDGASGNERWQFEIDDAVQGSPAVVNGTVYVGVHDNTVYGIGLASGTAENKSPTAAFDIKPSEPTVGQEVTFDASASTDPDGSIKQYRWDLTGDGELDTQGEQTTYVFEQTGEYEVTLTVVDEEGNEGTAEDSVTIRDEPTISLPADHVRVIQTVEDTSVDNSTLPSDERTVPDPDIVAGRPTSVLFKLEGRGLDRLGDSETVRLSVQTDTGVSKTADLRGKRIKELSYAPDEEPDSVEEAKVLATAPRAEQPPVFNIDTSTNRVYVLLGLDDNNVQGDQIELSEGADFTLTESRTIRIGFIEVMAPLDSKNGVGAGDWAYGADDGRLHTEYKLPGGDVELEAANSREMFDVIVDECERYLERVYPAENVEVLKYPNAMLGNRQGWVKGALSFWSDLKTAYDTLVNKFDTLDATVAIVPSDYHRYHGKGASGFHPNVPIAPTQPQAAASVEAQTLSIPGYEKTMLGDIVETAAQEIGHHFGGVNLYERDPLAQRQDKNTDGVSDEDFDHSHARTESMRNDPAGGRNSQVIDEYALRSTAFDLFNGTFSVLRENANRGYWARGRRLNRTKGDWNLGSFMSYSVDETWADSHVYQEMLDDEFSPTPPVASLPDADDVSVFSGIASVSDNGRVEVPSATKRSGRPMPDISEGSVKMEVTAPDGTTIETRRSPDSLKLLGNGGQNIVVEDTFTFVLPFPEESAKVEITHEDHGTKTSINPVAQTLRSAIRVVPDRGFKASPDSRRESLLERADNVQTEMANQQYDAASATLEQLRADVERWIKSDYDAAANQPTREELVSLIDDMRSRSNRLAEVTSRGLFNVPDWAPIAGGAGLFGLGAGAYKYLARTSDPKQDAYDPNQVADLLVQADSQMRMIAAQIDDEEALPEQLREVESVTPAAKPAAGEESEESQADEQVE